MFNAFIIGARMGVMMYSAVSTFRYLDENHERIEKELKGYAMAVWNRIPAISIPYYN